MVVTVSVRYSLLLETVLFIKYHKIRTHTESWHIVAVSFIIASRDRRGAGGGEAHCDGVAGGVFGVLINL